MAYGKLYIPKTAVSYSDAVDFASEMLAARHGGFTQYDGNGGWVNSKGDLVREPVTVLEVYGDGEDLSVDMDKIAEVVKDMTEEESVAYSYNGEMYFK